MERIKFMKSKRLCFGCLSNEHTAMNCPKRKMYAVVNCTRKHPTVLHTNSVAHRLDANNATASTLPHEDVLVFKALWSTQTEELVRLLEQMRGGQLWPLFLLKYGLKEKGHL